MKILLKRDETSLGFPGVDQISVGELVINSRTGKLYSKLIDGSIIEWSGKIVCPSNYVTEIKIYYKAALVDSDKIENFCGNGEVLEFEILPLISDFTDYTFEFVELTNNTSGQDIVVEQPVYSNYTENNITKSKASVRVNLTIDDVKQSTSIFKFSAIRNDISQKIIEKLITIQCL